MLMRSCQDTLQKHYAFAPENVCILHDIYPGQKKSMKAVRAAYLYYTITVMITCYTITLYDITCYTITGSAPKRGRHSTIFVLITVTVS